ncbi:ATP-binding protein [Patescibacteria group bacterium]|nr:ATP-binding protein [Patescibacteria group bacterium]MBU4082504.1 ATP-binding protein [Patescibacteria group bacterium]MCG2809003.1 ATP-binding protein [Candidatus Portnoybacteria bacterium]
MYKRLLQKQLKKKFFKGKILIIAGARQVGKTFLSLELVKDFPKKDVRLFNCDNPTDRQELANRDLEFLKQLIGDAKIIFIDEAQKVDNIGETLKLLVDYYKNKKQIIATGSSSLNLLDNTQEPLTGRKYVHYLFPLSLEEIYPDKNQLKLSKELESLLIFGSYPEIVAKSSFRDKKELLKELASSYIYKDILGFQEVKSPDILVKLLKALAFQVGSQVSYNELSRTVGIDKKTIERYINLLEKNFVIFRLKPFTKNKRREISKLKKVYFYDTGIRNAVIGDFSLQGDRNDIGALWENFMIIEKMKFNAYHNIDAELYFWRTYDGNEIDLIEEKEKKLLGYEFKWNDKQKKIGKSFDWLNSYKMITKRNLGDFVFMSLKKK